ncbi:site-specific integrase [Nostoc sp. 106C]|uniref:site-specific integrase n=1 Tax=Nostoc sp. 106C TaxID=1932667 RepID=UPI000A374559|nr:site-specific integrase [Nostoc sp. 106C]OUL34079.1 integrase [Nostoc sp. 106C]
MSEDRWIVTDKRTSKLVLRFRVKGFSQQFFISTGLKDTKRNREIVRAKRDAIANDITLGRFDATLESYQFQPSAIAPAALAVKEAEIKYRYNLQELWEKFTEFQATQLEETTIRGKYKVIASYILKLPTKDLESSASIRSWMLSNYTHYMTWVLLNYFSSCCNWAVDSGLINNNPFSALKIQQPKKSSQDESFRAFTLEQRDAIIKAFEVHRKHSYYAPLVKFLFFTGCRPGEAFALTWGDINDDCRRILINKSRNIAGILKGTKNGKKRIFPCEVGSKLQMLLLSIRPGHFNPNDLVFRSKTGKRINSSLMLDFWREERFLEKGRVYKRPGVVKELAVNGIVPYLPPYSCRHTFITWAISSGISPDKVALWVGDTTQTVLKHYCHPEIVNAECPDF